MSTFTLYEFTSVNEAGEPVGPALRTTALPFGVAKALATNTSYFQVTPAADAHIRLSRDGTAATSDDERVFSGDTTGFSVSRGATKSIHLLAAAAASGDPVVTLDITGRRSGEIVGLDVTIPNAASVSAWIDLGGALLGGVVLPSGWGTSNAANLGFRRAQDLGGTGEALLFDAFGTRIIVSPGGVALTEARAYAVNPADFWHSRFLRLVALNQSTGATITVAANRVVRLLARVP